MANTFSKSYRLANPSKRKQWPRAKYKGQLVRFRKANPKRKKGMSLLQKLHFGSLRQRAAAALRLKGSRSKKRSNSKVRRTRTGTRTGRKNIGEIRVHRFGNPARKRKSRKNIAAGFYDSEGIFHPIRASYDYSEKRAGEKGYTRFGRRARNPSKKRRKSKSMAKSRKRVLAGKKAARTRARHRGSRRSNPGVIHYRRRRRSSNPSVRHYTRRRRVHHNRGRRRNPGMLTGMSGKVLGVIGGATITKLITGMLPMGLNQGFVGYFSTGIVAFLQGNLIGKVSRNSALGNDMVVGGLTYLALRLIQDFLPNLGGSLGLSGMGLIAPSSFYVPQVNVRGSMSRFLVPPGVPTVQVVKSGMHGLQVNAVGGGRMGQRRMGRMS